MWAKGRDAVVMHRLVARTIRDRLERAGALDTALGAVADALTLIGVSEQQAWDHREAGLELVGHATALWTIALPAADRGALPPDSVEAQADLAAWAVRHLIATADLSRAAELGASVLRETERVLGPDHPDTLTSRNNLALAYQTAGNLTQAIPLHERTLADRERILGTDHPTTKTVGSNLRAARAARREP